MSNGAGDLSQALDRGQTNQLRSNARLTWSKGGSRLLVDTYAFQGLRSTDNTSTTPFILPLIDFATTFTGKLPGAMSASALTWLRLPFRGNGFPKIYRERQLGP